MANHDSEQGIHYHYHYYGNGASKQPAPPFQTPNATTPKRGASPLIAGILVGGAAAYLLTNEKTQKALIRTALKAWTGIQGGIEELKERFADVEAERAAADSGVPTSSTEEAPKDQQ